jgi:predicted dehydrogenase
LNPRILVVGTGSIGRRHITNLVSLGAQVSAYRYRGAVDPDPLPAAVDVVPNLDRALGEPGDGVVVANSTDKHMEVASAVAHHGKALFIEKPIATSLEGVGDLSRGIARRNLVVEVGFMLRFHPNVQWMIELLSQGQMGEIHHARAAVGQFLPDWRPGTDHRMGYGARRQTGGGVIFDLMHDLDLVSFLLGEVEDVSAMTRHVPSLEIETEAIAQIVIRLRSGILAQVQLDYVRPTYERVLEIVGSLGCLKWDYVEGTVTLSKAGSDRAIVHRVPPGFERNTMYVNHMRHFLDRIKTPGPPGASFADGVRALRIALACHRSAAERRHVRPSEIDEAYRVTSEGSTT